MPKSDVPKTYVRPDNTAVLTCPHCGYQKVVRADAFKGYKHILKVRCLCQKAFKVVLEFRNRVRKKTFLRGTFVNHSRENSSGYLFIQDISVSGLAFTRVDTNKFQVGDELTIEFTLDDEHRTEISKDVIVRDIRQNSVGCEYEISEDTFGSPLGYYITSDK